VTPPLGDGGVGDGGPAPSGGADGDRDEDEARERARRRRPPRTVPCVERAMLVSSVRVRSFGVRTSSARGLVAKHKARPDQPPAVASSAARSLARRASPYEGDRCPRSTRSGRCRGSKRKKLIDIGGVCLLAGRAFSALDGGRAGCELFDRAAEIGRSASGAGFLGAARERARSIHHTPPLLFTRPRLEGQARESARRRTAASWGRRATRVPRWPAARTAAQRPPAGAA
jgi:hypothetical protein